MAGHPLEYTPYATVNPIGGTGARESIQTSPDMFGAAIARGEASIGQGLQKAGDEGTDIATQQATLDANSHANELNAYYAKRTTDLSEKFFSLRGKDADMALPQYQQDLDDARKETLGQATNPYTRQLVDNNTRQITDSSYRAAARHAGDQKAQWDQTSALEKAGSYGSLAAVHATALPPDVDIQTNPNVALYLNTSDGAAREAAIAKGLDGDIEAQKNRGRNVGQIVKSLVADGSQQSLRRAWSFLGSQDDKIDPASRATIEQGLRAQTSQFNGQMRADGYMGRGTALPPGYVQRTFQIESGGNPTAQTGSYRGLGQFSPALERRYGINDSNRDDPQTQARALSMENAENHDALATALGHEPTPADYYLAHQQGVGGALAHLREPNLPAWQNMASTGEGQQKGAGWARQAIWGNMTPQMKAQFPGGVDTVTSADFTRMWSQRFYGQPIQAGGATAAGLPVPRLQMAQDFSQSNKGEVIQKIADDPFLRDHPQAMQAAISHANQVFEAQSASYADMERSLHVQEQQKKLVSDDAENSYMEQIYAPPQNAKPISVQQIVTDPRLSRESKERLIKQIGGSEEKDDKTYGQGFVHALQMVHAPAGTNGRITDPNQLYDRVGKDLTYAGFTKLRDEINLKRSPEGDAETEMKRDFLRTAKGQISGSDEGLHIKDPKGDELYLKFMAQVLPAYDKGRKDGKSPTQLLDPDSPDYVGKIITNFKRPMDQWFNDVVHSDAPAAGAAAKAAFDIKSVKSLDDLVSAYRAGNVTKQQADEMALAQGWAVRKKPVAPTVPVSQ